MKTRINIATSNGYILDNGKLAAYEFKSAKVDFYSIGYTGLTSRMVSNQPTKRQIYDLQRID